ncbi:hypothetical protein ACSBPU_13110 [Parapusillimonas sp. JC17]|uniref:hypothetical protein n=1 Tax=Parapusillimonas sp. JC17 TaxID=3445768 RepID=UPI003F9F9764
MTTDNKPTNATQELRAAADRAYCLYIEKMRTTECLGWEEKVKSRKFGLKELEAHIKAGVFLGMSRALSEAADIVAKHAQPVMPADDEMAAEYQRWIDAHHQGMDYDDFLKQELARRRIERE